MALRHRKIELALTRLNLNQNGKGHGIAIRAPPSTVCLPVRVPHNLKDLQSGSSYPLVSSKMAYRSYLCLIKLSSPGAVGSSLDIVGNDHLAARYMRGD